MSQLYIRPWLCSEKTKFSLMSELIFGLIIGAMLGVIAGMSPWPFCIVTAWSASQVAGLFFHPLWLFWWIGEFYTE